MHGELLGSERDVSSSPQIARVGPENASAVEEMVRRFKNSSLSEAYIRSILSNPSNLLFVARVAGAVVGFLWAHKLDRLREERPHYFVYEIEVLAGHQRQGVGRLLLESVLAAAREEGAETFVFTNRSNAKAVAFYRSTGGAVKSDDDLLFVYRGLA